MNRFTHLFTRLAVGLSALGMVACGETAPKAETPLEVSIAPLIEPFPDVAMTSGKLSGQYKMAGENTPVVLIIPGSGPTDLNGNNPMSGTSNVYRQLAMGLAKQGISTVRVDKYGMFSSADAGDANQVTVESYAKDYSGWVETIRTETGAACVYVLGHSEGALMASAAANINENICGLILVSGMGRPFGDVLREQLKAQPGSAILMKDALANIDILERGERIPDEDLDFVSKRIFPSQVQGFVLSLIQTNPSDMAKAANKRTLIVHGETDIQTSVADAEALAEATGGTLAIIPGVNHILKTAPKNRGKNIQTYSQPDLPISPLVVEAIAEFVKA